METSQQQFIVISLSQKSYVSVQANATLADVRVSILDTWDEFQYPEQFNFKVDELLISTKQESDHLAFDIIKKGGLAELMPRPRSKKRNMDDRSGESTQPIAKSDTYSKSTELISRPVSTKNTGNDVEIDITLGESKPAINPQVMARLHPQHKHPDGKSRRVPPSWVMPTKISFLAIYQYWHCGDETNNIPPMKYLTKSDVEYLGRGAKIRLSELRKLMNIVDKAAAENGHTPKQFMSLAEASTCFFHGEKAILDLVPPNTPQGRARVVSMIKWSTVVKYTHKKRGGEPESEKKSSVESK